MVNERVKRVNVRLRDCFLRQKLDYPTEPIEQIIEEEMAAYLDGAIDEKTTAERIQSRASLYLMEQKVQ